VSRLFVCLFELVWLSFCVMMLLLLCSFVISCQSSTAVFVVEMLLLSLLLLLLQLRIETLGCQFHQHVCKQLLRLQIPKAQKDSQVTSVFFVLLGSAWAKVAPKMLLKLTPGITFINTLQPDFLNESNSYSVNFINILRADFVPIFFKKN